MACIRKRRGKWVVDYRDAAGIRRWATCETRREAEDVLAKKVPESRQSTRPAVNPDITVSEYSKRWLSQLAASVKSHTVARYEQNLRRHVLPPFETVKVRHLQKGRLKDLLVEKLSKFSRSSVQSMLSTLRAMLNAAVDDGLILTNPADRLARQLRLASPATARQDAIKALTGKQLARFLAVAAEKDRRHFPLFLLLARTGMRLGEALALRWEDVDSQSRQIRVARTLYAGGRIETPKAGRGRTVDMSQELTRVLLRLQVERKTETLRRGWPGMPSWVFCSEAGGPLIPWKVERDFKRVLKAAGLPMHFTPHGLRHTYASLLLQMGVGPVYVQRQLGHASIKMTVDVYGRWLPMGNQAIADLLDGESGSKMVAATGLSGAAMMEAPSFPGTSGLVRSEGGRTRGSSEPASE